MYITFSEFKFLISYFPAGACEHSKELCWQHWIEIVTTNHRNERHGTPSECLLFRYKRLRDADASTSDLPAKRVNHKISFFYFFLGLPPVTWFIPEANRYSFEKNMIGRIKSPTYYIVYFYITLYYSKANVVDVNNVRKSLKSQVNIRIRDVLMLLHVKLNVAVCYAHYVMIQRLVE